MMVRSISDVNMILKNVFWTQIMVYTYLYNHQF